MFYKKSLMAVFGLSLALSSNFAMAQIPVTDGAQIASNELVTMAESAKQIAEMAKQLEEAQRLYKNAVDQLDAFKSEAQNMKNRLEGFSNFGSALSDGDMGKLLNDFLGTVSKVDIDKYINAMGGLSSIGDGFKTGIKSNAVQSSQYEAMIKQLSDKDNELRALKQQMKNADTPQKREELANVIALEQLEQKNRSDAMEIEVKKQAVDADSKKKIQRANFVKEQMTLPSYLKQ